MPLLLPLLIAALLFAIGVYGVLARRNAICVLMGVELMLNAVNLNLIAFDTLHRDPLHSGQVFTLYIITIAAAEIGLALAIVMMVFRSRREIVVDRLRDLRESGAPYPAEPEDRPEDQDDLDERGGPGRRGRPSEVVAS